MKHGFLVLFLALNGFSVYSQSGYTNKERIDVLNHFVEFTNESINGMLVINHLLMSLNQDVNEYIDLPQHSIGLSQYGMFEINVFDDSGMSPEGTPNSIFKKCMAYPNIERVASDNLISLAKEINALCNKSNILFHGISTYISSHDLSETDALNTTFDKLEKAVELFDRFGELRELVASELRKLTTNQVESPHLELYQLFNETHAELVNIAYSVKESKDKKLKERISHVTTIIDKLRIKLNASPYSQAPNLNIHKKKIFESIDRLLGFGNKYANYTPADSSYSLYGRNFFWYNIEMITCVNAYGSGYAPEMNHIIDKLGMPYLHFVELPHIFKIMYPKKLRDSDLFVSSDEMVEEIPDKLNDRTIVTNTQVIEVDSSVLELNLYDHMIQDGDIIALNFNGDWIMEDHSLESKPTKIKLQLNEEGKNFLILHAESVGKKPPNTMAISYVYKGKRQKNLMKSDLRASEMIEIRIAK